MKRVVFVAIFLLPVFQAFSQDKLLNILKEELEREMKEFQSEETPPYYIEYRVSDFLTYDVNTSFGSLTSSGSYKNRVFSADMRMGDYEMDNTHELDPQSFGYGGSSEIKSTAIPIENDANSIKQIIWLTTDQLYKDVQNQYYMVINSEKTNDEDTQPDFSKEEPAKYFDPLINEADTRVDIKKWENVLKDLSAKFKVNPYIIDGVATLNVIFERRYFISTEGSEIVQNFSYADVSIAGSIMCDDGNVLPLYLSFDAFDEDDLPSPEEMQKKTDEMVTRLIDLRKAPVAEPYTGPAIFSPRVAGVFFHEIFGHRIEGHRLKMDTDGQTFKNQVGNKVLPKFLSVVSDPTLKSFKDRDLVGNYVFDDQGVKGKPVTLVEEGILKNFLMSRSPLKSFSQSNGHGRAMAGNAPVSRQSNLIVKSDEVVDEETLRKLLIKECKKQKKDFGYYFKDVTGGFTTTDRYMPNAFNIMPTEVYKVYVDGRPDELVRGVDMIGTPLAMFSEIEAAGNTTDVFTGHCGAESGFIPVTAIAPSLFVKKIETQKKMESLVKLPILKSPEFEFNLNQNSK